MTLGRLLATWLIAGAMIVSTAEGGLALGPALILVRDVQVGRKFSLGEVAKVRYQLINNGDEAAVYSVKAVAPDSYNFAEFELGYEPAPDMAWFRLDREEVEVPAHGRAEVDLTVDIPDRPELRNRHWIVAIEAGRPQKMAIGAALRLRARIMLETEVAPPAGLTPGGAEIALAPAVVRMRQQADGGWLGETQIGNGTSAAAEYDVLTASDAYPGELSRKLPRYFERAADALLNERWAVPPATSLAVAALASGTLQLTAPAKAALNPGEARDEVVFVARRQRGETRPQGSFTAKGVVYERLELLRLRYEGPAAIIPLDSAKP